MNGNPIQWDYNNPFVIEFTVEPKHIDPMGHTNNVIYLRWLERVAWQHSESLGLDWPTYEKLDRAMVARRTEIDYLASALADDELILATWITDNDGRVTLTRHYQLVRKKDNKTLVRAMTRWACVDISRGRLQRMPAEFISGYKVTI